ncbi:MAG: hypothetical protein JXA75_01895 [Candidatus Thermoplasmatota archaeon]|nr:hypothetical protein [Candidatus Thermoplasmatota archaeon]
MGKTIALKLTKKEEKIVSQWNQKGLTNSDLLRTALRHYVENICDVSSEDPLMKDIFVKQNHSSIDFSKALNELTVQMQALKEQVKMSQQQVENELKRVQRQVSLLTTDTPTSEQLSGSVKFDTLHAVHQQIDELLWKPNQNGCFKKDSE